MSLSFHYLTMANHMLIQKKLLERAKDTGLTIGQPKVLDYLKDHDGANQKEIAAGCHIEAGSLTSILNRMESKAMIERRTLNGNRRAFHIYLTEYGKDLQNLVAKMFVQIEETALKGIKKAEQEAFLETFEKIYHNLSGNEEFWNE
ncbi:MAG: MarR family winged helix-turn-helix transcriptional regulator [Lachnospiraceae bacterium]